MRGIIGYIIFFTIGLVSAGAYFYQLHPEHSPETDLPRLRDDLDNAMERGRRLKEAWNSCGPEASRSEATRQD